MDPGGSGALGAIADRTATRPRRRTWAVAGAVGVLVLVVAVVGIGRARTAEEQPAAAAPPATTAAPIVPTDGFPGTPAQWEQYARDHHPDVAITWAAYEAAVTQTVDCVRQAGMGILRPELGPGGRFLYFSYGGGPEVDAVVQSCRRRHEDGPTRTWTIATALSPADRATLEARVAQCIAHGRAAAQPPGTGTDDPEYACVMGGAQDALSGPAA